MLTWLLTLHDAPDCLLLIFLVNVFSVHSMVTIIALQLRFLGIQFIEDIFNMSWAHFEPKPLGILTTYIIFPLDHLKGQKKSNLLCTSYCSLNFDSCSCHTSLCGCLHYIHMQRTISYRLSFHTENDHFYFHLLSQLTALLCLEPFLMMVAAGPFTTSDSLLYEPLADLMKTVENDRPDLLILVSQKYPSLQFLIVVHLHLWHFSN